MTGRALRVAFSIAAVCAATARADAGSFHGGLRLGLAYTNIHGDLPDLAGPESQTGLVVGGFAEYQVVPSLALEVDALYTQKGARFVSEATDPAGNPIGIVETHLRLNYLEVPLLVRLSLPLEAPITPYLIGGPTVAFALSGKFESNNGDGDLSDDMEAIDLGVTGGLGARFGRGPVRFAVEARYGTGFNDLWDLTGNLDSINDGYSFTLGITR